MIRLLLTLSSLLLAVRAQCDTPDMAPGPLPVGIGRDHGPQYDDVSPIRTMICPQNYVAQADVNADPFTLGGMFSCNKTTLKYTNDDGYEAIKLMSCVTGSAPFCPIFHKQQGGGIGYVAIYPGKEQICGTGKKLLLDNGQAFSKLKCRPDGWIEFEFPNGPSAQYEPTLRCEEPFVACKMPKEVPASQFPTPVKKGEAYVVTRAMLEGKEIFLLSCDEASYQIAQLGNGTQAFRFDDIPVCDKETGIWRLGPYSSYAAPEFMSCGTIPAGSILPFCSIEHVQSDGASRPVAVKAGNEQICPVGQQLQFADGRSIKTITCNADGDLAGTLDIVTATGSVIVRSPKLVCVTAAASQIDPNLIIDIIEISAGSNLTFSYYFYKVTEEFKPSVEVNGVITYYAKLELTQCRKDVPADKAKIRTSPNDCPLKADAKPMYLVIKRIPNGGTSVNYISTAYETKPSS